MSDTVDLAAVGLPDASARADAVPQGGEAETPAPQAAETPEEAAGTAEEPNEEPEGGTPAWLQKRIDRSVQAQRRAERAAAEKASEAAYWRGAAERAAQQAQPAPAAAPASQPTMPPDLAAYVGPEPQPAEFQAGEFDPAYGRAVARFEAKAELARAEMHRRQGQQQASAQQAQAALQRSMDAIVTEGRGRFADFDDVVGSIAALSDPAQARAGLMLRHQIAECEKPADVAYWLGANPKEAARIAALHPTAMARELTRVEARMVAPPKPVTAAPPPPRTLRGGTSSRSDLASMSVGEIAKSLGLPG